MLLVCLASVTMSPLRFALSYFAFVVVVLFVVVIVPYVSKKSIRIRFFDTFGTEFYI